MPNSLRIIFAGTKDFSAKHLTTLINNTKHQIVGVFTKPDKPSGRGNPIVCSPVKQLANKHNLRIFQPVSLNTPEIQYAIEALNSDIMVVVSYGLILPNNILNAPRLGCINVHASLLPRWRGAAPIQRALLSGDNLTGITIIHMDANLDAGNILYKDTCIIQPGDTSLSLYYKLTQIGPKTLLAALAKINEIFDFAIPQNKEFVTYANKLSKKEALINWNLPATYLERSIRAFNPWPTSYFSYAGQNIKVWAAKVNNEQIHQCTPGTILSVEKNAIHVATGKGALIITEIQQPCKKSMTVKNFLNAHREWFIPGTILT